VRVVERLGGELKVITVQRGQTLVAVWPLYSRRESGRVVARHLGCESNEEYSGPLIRDDEDANEIAARALELARTFADVLEIYCLRWPSLLPKVIAENRLFEDRHFARSPVPTLRGFGNFETWLATKSNNFRSQDPHPPQKPVGSRGSSIHGAQPGSRYQGIRELADGSQAGACE
jgi:hypothetical protein